MPSMSSNLHRWKNYTTGTGNTMEEIPSGSLANVWPTEMGVDLKIHRTRHRKEEEVSMISSKSVPAYLSRD